MKQKMHVFNTWLLALLFFPIIALAWESFRSGEIEWSLLVALGLFGTLFSLPALVLCWVAIGPVLHASLTVEAKLVLWLLAVALIILLAAFLIVYLFFGIVHDPELLRVTASAIIAALLSILLRRRQFFHLAMQTETYEKDLV